MAKLVEIQGYMLALDKIVHVTRVFPAGNDEGFQFNIRMLGDTLLKLKFPDRAAAALDRDLLIKAWREA